MAVIKISELPQVLSLGNQSEQGKSVQFDVSEWNTLYPGARYEITYIRPGETGSWPATGVTHSNGTLTWVVSRSVTLKAGQGSFVIHCYVNEDEKNSGEAWYFIGGGHEIGETPDTVAEWLAETNAAEALRESAETARETAEGLRDTAEGLRAGAETSRNTAEGLRLSAEISRNSAEGLRYSAEISRKEAEALRVAAEAVRMGFKPMGAYNPANENKYGEWYTHEGGSYGYIYPTPSTGVPVTDTTHWQKIASQGLKGDAFEYEDFTPEQLAGLVGNGIKSILRTSGDGTPGTTDTYTITFDDDSTTTFPVYNGADAPALSGVKQYIIRWDKVNSQCTRMGDASAITTTITNFCHRGSVNASYSNPFDSLYPWKYRKLCKVNRAAYAALPAGSPITDAVTMWEGEPGFALDGTGDFDGVYTPEFWGRTWQDATYVYAGVADGPIPGWQHFEATIGGRYFGSLDGSSKITSIANSLPYRNAQLSTMHTNVTAQGMTLDDIFTWSADNLLMAVEYATLNSETAIGKGVDGLYRASSEKVGEAVSIGATVLKLPNAFVSACVAGALIGLGTANDGEQTGVTRFISSADLNGADPLFATHKAVTVPALTVNVTTDTFICIHGQTNLPDAAIGSMSGYIGVNGKCNTYYRGRVSHGNFLRYCLGAYRQTGTGEIWVANSRNEAAAADALNTGVHRDTGLALPTASNYIAELHRDNLLPMAPFAKATGGTAGSTNPVGDYCYVPTLETENTILRLSGHASGGANAGRFYGVWNDAASYSAWNIACLPWLKTP